MGGAPAAVDACLSAARAPWHFAAAQVGRQEPVMVLRVDKEKGYIDLSKRWAPSGAGRWGRAVAAEAASSRAGPACVAPAMDVLLQVVLPRLDCVGGAFGTPCAVGRDCAPGVRAVGALQCPGRLCWCGVCSSPCSWPDCGVDGTLCARHRSPLTAQACVARGHSEVRGALQQVQAGACRGGWLHWGPGGWGTWQWPHTLSGQRCSGDPGGRDGAGREGQRGLGDEAGTVRHSPQAGGLDEGHGDVSFQGQARIASPHGCMATTCPACQVEEEDGASRLAQHCGQRLRTLLVRVCAVVAHGVHWPTLHYLSQVHSIMRHVAETTGSDLEVSSGGTPGWTARPGGQPDATSPSSGGLTYVQATPAALGSRLVSSTPHPKGKFDFFPTHGCGSCSGKQQSTVAGKGRAGSWPRARWGLGWAGPPPSRALPCGGGMPPLAS